MHPDFTQLVTWKIFDSKSQVYVEFMHPNFTQLISGVQKWSLSRDKVEFWSGYFNSKILPWLGKNWDSKSRVKVEFMHPDFTQLVTGLLKCS